MLVVEGASNKCRKMIISISLQPRSAAIATYAVCGFANPSSMGIMIGTLSAMTPDKRGVITSVAFRAFMAGSIVCFMTASIGGLLMDDAIFNGFGRSCFFPPE